MKTVEIDFATQPGETAEEALVALKAGFDVIAEISSKPSGNCCPVARIAGSRDQVCLLLQHHGYDPAEYGFRRPYPPQAYHTSKRA